MNYLGYLDEVVLKLLLCLTDLFTHLLFGQYLINVLDDLILEWALFNVGQSRPYITAFSADRDTYTVRSPYKYSHFVLGLVSFTAN